MGEKAFSETGFANWKKALEKFKSHDESQFHREATLKWAACGRPTIAGQLNAQIAQLQEDRREGLLAQLAGIQFLTRQGIAIRGHTESEGNLAQLLLMQSRNNEVVKRWIKENRFTSHDVVTEQICTLGQTLLHTLLGQMKGIGPAWYSIIADEATDVVNSEQLNLSIRWVNDDYEVHEDPVGLFRVSDTKVETLFSIIKDILI